MKSLLRPLSLLGSAPGASSPGRRLAGGAAWTIAGAVASRGSTLIASLVVARMLGRTAFGRLGVVESSVGMFAVFSGMGLSLTSTKFVAKYWRTDPARAGRILGLCCVFAAASGLAIGLGVFVGAAWLAGETLGDAALAEPLQAAAAILVLGAVSGALSGALVGFQAFRELAWVNLAAGLAWLPLLAAGAAWGGLRGVVIGMVAAQAAGVLLYFIQLRRTAGAHRVPLSLRGCWQERAVLGSFSLPALLNSSLRSPVNWLCVALLVNQAGGYAQMGLLHAVNPWFLLLLFLPNQLANVYFPMFEEALARGDRDSMRHILRRSTQANLAVCAFVAAIVAVGADWIVSWYGPEYREAARVMRITVITGLIVAAQQPLAAYLVSVCNMWLVTLCSLAWAAACVGATYLLLDYGAVGIATARLAGYAVYAALVAAIGLKLVRRPVLAVSEKLPHVAESLRDSETPLPLAA